jgi:hypothetical protein
MLHDITMRLLGVLVVVCFLRALQLCQRFCFWFNTEHAVCTWTTRGGPAASRVTACCSVLCSNGVITAISCLGACRQVVFVSIAVGV